MHKNDIQSKFLFLNRKSLVFASLNIFFSLLVRFWCVKKRTLKVQTSFKRFLTFSILICIKAYNWFCTQIIFENPIKPGFNKKCTAYNLCWATGVFELYKDISLKKKQVLIELLKIIGIQIIFFLSIYLWK